MPDLGVYLHFPWCRNLCSYCDFPVVVAGDRAPPHAAYRDAILRELDARAREVDGRHLVSIYFGGGTPSLWAPACLRELIAEVSSRWDHDDLEITLEANPTDCTVEKMAAWRAAGINRLSIGVQSLDAGDLAVLGRDHAMGDGADGLAAALLAGFTSVSADLILGAPPPPDRPRPIGRRPVQGPRAAPPSLFALIASGVPHLSIYELTIEPRTALGRARDRGALVPLDEDVIAELYEAVHAATTDAGFEHYEVSSYARPGHQSRHNALYWRGAEYLGLGVGAASFTIDPDGAGRRRVNDRSAVRYLRGDRVSEVTVTRPDELARDRLWLALRTSRGAAVDDLPAALRDQLLSEGLCEREGERVRPTLRGFLLNDRIARLAASIGS